jgi:hypothetical protein
MASNRVSMSSGSLDFLAGLACGLATGGASVGFAGVVVAGAATGLGGAGLDGGGFRGVLGELVEEEDGSCVVGERLDWDGVVERAVCSNAWARAATVPFSGISSMVSP